MPPNPQVIQQNITSAEVSSPTTTTFSQRLAFMKAELEKTERVLDDHKRRQGEVAKHWQADELYSAEQVK